MEEKRISNSGRPSIEEDIDKQLEYYKIFHTKVTSLKSYPEVAKDLGISVTKVGEACRWVRDNWEKLATPEFYIESEAFVRGRIQELTAMIEEQTALVRGNPERGIAPQPLLRMGLLNTMAQRAVYDKMWLEVRGTINATTTLTQNIQVNVHNEQKLEIVNLSDEDRQKLIEMAKRYGEPPK